MLKNGSFTEDWTDLPPAPGYLINQQPNGWMMTWVEQDSPLYGSGDLSKGVPECVHKLASQLPPNEQLGAPDALILAGDVTYKIFHANAPFGAELKQRVTGLAPGTAGKFIAPVLAVLHGDNDMYGCESGAWVDTTGSSNPDDWEGQWANAAQMGNRKWYHHEVNFTVPPSGEVTVYIRVKSKWPAPKDFFIDGVKLEAQAGGPESYTPPAGSHPTTPVPTPPGDANTITVVAPRGLNVIMDISDTPNTIIVKLPAGMRLNVQDAE